jgi:hypothetical protein
MTELKWVLASTHVVYRHENGPGGGSGSGAILMPVH